MLAYKLWCYVMKSMYDVAMWICLLWTCKLWNHDKNTNMQVYDIPFPCIHGDYVMLISHKKGYDERTILI